MDNWNVLAAQTSSQAIGLHDSGVVKTRLVSTLYIEHTHVQIDIHIRCSKQNKARQTNDGVYIEFLATNIVHWESKRGSKSIITIKYSMQKQAVRKCILK